MVKYIAVSGFVKFLKFSDVFRLGLEELGLSVSYFGRVGDVSGQRLYRQVGGGYSETVVRVAHVGGRLYDTVSVQVRVTWKK